MLLLRVVVFAIVLVAAASSFNHYHDASVLQKTTDLSDPEQDAAYKKDIKWFKITLCFAVLMFAIWYIMGEA